MKKRHSLWAALALGLTATALAQPLDFTVSAGSETFRLSEARGRFVALHFLLKTDCPYCRQEVSETVRRTPEVAGVTHVFLKPDAEAEIKNWNERLRSEGVPATIFRDADAQIAKQLKIPDGYQFHGESVHYPALVLVGPDGQEKYRHVGKDNADRLSFDALGRKIVDLSRHPGIQQYNLTEKTLALGGHDPVAYFDAGKADRGKPEITSQYLGVTYRFATMERRAKFAGDPEKYTPAYGGWCATAMAEGRKVEIDPANFKVTDGRLFLFYKGWLGNAINDWNKDEKNLAVKADQQWRKLAPADADERK